MKKDIIKYFFPITILITSIILAAAAACFSIFGLSKLFAGAATAVIIMASILEFSKIITTTWLHKNWKSEINKSLKFILLTMVVVLMIITSSGIYGFLSNAYFATSSELNKVETKITLADKQKIIHENKIVNYEKTKETKNNRIENLTTLRLQQENRIDSLFKKGMIGAVKRTELQIKDANKEIELLMKYNEKLDSLIQVENLEISKLELDKADLKSSDIAAEVGPLKYIAKLTGKDMDSVINWFIMSLILVFDPLAITLLIAANSSFDKLKKENENVIQKIEPNIINNNDPLSVETLLNNNDSNVVESTIIKNTNFEQNTEKNTSSNLLDYNDDSKKEPIQIPEKIQNFFEKKEESELEFKKRIEELNKQNNIELSTNTNSFNIYPVDNTVTITGAPTNETSLKKEESLYLKLLSVLFRDGEIEINQEIPSYSEFINELKRLEIKYNDTLIRDFLSACNLLKVIDTDKNKKIATKSYEAAREIMSKI